MTEQQEFAKLFAEYQATYGNELRAKVRRLDGIIGRSHWLSVGTYKESILRAILRNKVPTRFEIGTGFVLSHEGTKRVLSRQIDILIWDAASHAPFFRDEEFVIVPPEACVGAIEVKSTLNKKELKKSLENLDSLMQFFRQFPRQHVLHRSVFAFELGEDLTFPDGVWQQVLAFYRRTNTLAFQERVRFSTSQHEYDRWPLPWITNIAVLGVGVLNCDLWSLNDESSLVYAAYRTTETEDAIDAYGFVERSLLMDLILGYRKHYARDTVPGFAGALFANRATPFPGKWYMPIPPKSVQKVGRFTGKKNDEWIEGAFNPTVRKRNTGSRSRRGKKAQ